MSRDLSDELDVIQIRADGRRPAYKIEIYDVRSTSDTINDIVRGLQLQSETGPRDFTGDVAEIRVEEVAGNFVETGVASSSITFTVVDPNNQFDPFNTIDDPEGDGRWLRRGNVVRLYEGDERVAPADWALTFTGILQGQAGVRESRNVSDAPQRLQCKAVDRSPGFLRYKNTSENFDTGTSYGTMINSIAQGDMGLDSDEIDFSGVGDTVSALPVQFVKEEALVSLARLLMVDGFLPRFNGEGKLTQATPLILTTSDRNYTDDAIFTSINRPFNEQSPVNTVTVIGLDGDLSEVIQPDQNLASLSLTTGYFTQDDEVEVYWSDDQTILAKNARENVVKSVNGGLSVLGGGEEFELIPSPNSQPGSVGVRVTVSSGFAPYLIIFLTVTYVALAWVPDGVAVALVAGKTIPWGRAVQAAALATNLIIMTKIGRGQYEFKGVPFEFVFKEIKGVAQIEGTLSQDKIEVTIENHLIQGQDAVDDLARDVLFEQQARGNAREITMLHDLRLEPHDVFFDVDNRSYQIIQINRTLTRPGNGLAQVQVFETTQGLDP